MYHPASSLWLVCVWTVTSIIGLPAPAFGSVTQSPAMSLATAEQLAVAHAPAVLASQAQVRAAAAAYIQAKGLLLPSVFGNYAQSPQGNPPGPTINSHLETVGLQIALNDLQSASPLIAQAALLFTARQADAAAAELTTKLQIAGEYYDALRSAAIVVARREALNAATGQNQAAAIRVAAGDAPALDVMRAQIMQLRAQAEFQSAQSDAQNAQDSLMSDLGTSADTSAVLLPATTGELLAQPPTAESSAARALANRPEIRSAQAALQAAEFAVKAARRTASAPLTLALGVSRGVDSGVAVAGPNLSLGLTLPFPAVAHSHTQAALAARDGAAAALLQVERSVSLAARLAARAYATALENRQLRDQEVVLALRELRAAQIGYRQAALSSLDAAAAQNAFVQATIESISAQYDTEKAYAVLELTVGNP